MQRPRSAPPSVVRDKRTSFFWRQSNADGAVPERIESLLGPNLKVHGDVSFAGGLRIDGRVTGDVVVHGADDGTLTIGDGGYVEGSVRVSKLVVYGHIHGDVHATGLVDVRANALIRGDVHYGSLEMVAGSVIHGKLIRHKGSSPF
jgi:cytoskeletal protein CcmA (bactofilin family)